MLLKLENFVFDAVFADDAVGDDFFGLADAVGAVDGLGFDGGIPPGVEEEDVVGGGEIESDPAGFEADKKDGAVGSGLKAVNFSGAVFALSIEVRVGNVLLIELGFDDG